MITVRVLRAFNVAYSDGETYSGGVGGLEQVIDLPETLAAQLIASGHVAAVSGGGGGGGVSTEVDPIASQAAADAQADADAAQAAADAAQAAADAAEATAQAAAAQAAAAAADNVDDDAAIAAAQLAAENAQQDAMTAMQDAADAQIAANALEATATQMQADLAALQAEHDALEALNADDDAAITDHETRIATLEAAPPGSGPESDPIATPLANAAQASADNAQSTADAADQRASDAQDALSLHAQDAQLHAGPVPFSALTEGLTSASTITSGNSETLGTFTPDAAGLWMFSASIASTTSTGWFTIGTTAGGADVLDWVTDTGSRLTPTELTRTVPVQLEAGVTYHVTAGPGGGGEIVEPGFFFAAGSLVENNEARIDSAELALTAHEDDTQAHAQGPFQAEEILRYSPTASGVAGIHDTGFNWHELENEFGHVQVTILYDSNSDPASNVPSKQTTGLIPTSTVGTGRAVRHVVDGGIIALFMGVVPAVPESTDSTIYIDTAVTDVILTEVIVEGFKPSVVSTGSPVVASGQNLDTALTAADWDPVGVTAAQDLAEGMAVFITFADGTSDFTVADATGIAEITRVSNGGVIRVRTNSGAVEMEGQAGTTIDSVLILRGSSEPATQTPAITAEGSGYWYDVGNVRIQYGRTTVTDADNDTITLPQPYADADYSIQVSMRETAGGIAGTSTDVGIDIWIDAQTATTFGVDRDNDIANMVIEWRTEGIRP